MESLTGLGDAPDGPSPHDEFACQTRRLVADLARANGVSEWYAAEAVRRTLIAIQREEETDG